MTSHACGAAKNQENMPGETVLARFYR